MDKCQFCGSIQDTESGSKYAYTCRTEASGFTGNPIFLRSHICYETEIQHLKALVREMGEIVQDVSSEAYKSSAPDNTNGVYFCQRCHGEWGYTHYGNCLVEFAQAILSRPEVRAILEETDS